MPAKVGVLRQERQATSIPQFAIVHSNATDLILNTGSMRNASLTDKLRLPVHSSESDLMNSIHVSVAAEIDRRKIKDTGQTTRGRGGKRGRARGKGVGRGSGLRELIEEQRYVAGEPSTSNSSTL